MKRALFILLIATAAYADRWATSDRFRLVGPAARSHTWGPLALPSSAATAGGHEAYLAGPDGLVVRRALSADGWVTSVTR